MEKKKYFTPKSVYLPIDIETSLLDNSPGGDNIGISGGSDGDDMAKERPTDFSFGFDSNEE